jgi:hypothetical protein
MSERRDDPGVSSGQTTKDLEVGGLRFHAEFRAPSGATLRVYGPTARGPEELLRFDDFVGVPHYHVPAEGEPISLDPAVVGDPLDWYVGQLKDHLEDMLADGGFRDILSVIDLSAVAEQAGDIRQMMVDCVPAGYVRTPGVGLQRA